MHIAPYHNFFFTFLRNQTQKSDSNFPFFIFIFFKFFQFSTRTRTKPWFRPTTRPPTSAAPPTIPITAPSYTTAEPVVSARRWPFPFRWPSSDLTTSSPTSKTAFSAAAAWPSQSTSTAASACRPASTSRRRRPTSSRRVPTQLSLRQSRWRCPLAAARTLPALTGAWRFAASLRCWCCCGYGDGVDSIAVGGQHLITFLFCYYCTLHFLHVWGNYGTCFFIFNLIFCYFLFIYEFFFFFFPEIFFVGYLMFWVIIIWV